MKREDLAELGLSAQSIDKIMALHGRDVEKNKASAQDWEQKYKDDTAALQTQLVQTQYQNAAENAVRTLKFSSESAKKAFTQALTQQKLPLAEGVMTGFDDFTAQYRQSDPAAFVSEAAAKMPVLVQPTGNTAPSTVPDSALRAAFGL
ncbi:MAG: hypothetical protein RR759_00780 [Ruthenibacterium sp.]